jgi:hypothetical protein
MPPSFSWTNGEERNGKSKLLSLAPRNCKARNERPERHDSTNLASLQKLQLLSRRVDSKATPSDVYSTLYANANHSVWLDSSNSHEGDEMA